jgi:hypothetical protein
MINFFQSFVRCVNDQPLFLNLGVEVSLDALHQCTHFPFSNIAESLRACFPSLGAMDSRKENYSFGYFIDSSSFFQ